MDIEELALTVLALSAGIVVGFVLFTYAGPMITGNAPAPSA